MREPIKEAIQVSVISSAVAAIVIGGVTLATVIKMRTSEPFRPAKVTYYGGHGARYAECSHDEMMVTPSYNEMEKALGDQAGTIAWDDYRDAHTLCMKAGDYSAR